MNKGIALVGNLIVDTIKYVETYPAPGTLTTILREDRSLGGLACNCTTDLALLDPELPLKVVGVVGDDERGDYIAGRLGGHRNVDTSGILRMGATSYTDVMTDPDGGRTFFTYMGANGLLRPEHIDFGKIGADLVHIGYILLLDGLDRPDPDYPTTMCRVLADARAHGAATSIDVVSDESDRYQRLVPPALAYTDYCTINEIEAERTTGIPLRDGAGNIIAGNLQGACEALIAMGVSRWAVIHMPELACGLEAGGRYVQKDSWKIPPGFKKSSVGAGDAFACGILYGAYHGWGLDKSIHVAGAVAAHSLSGAGGSDAILPLPEIMAAMERLQ